MYDPNSLMPQSDLFNTSQLLAQVAQNPEQYIPQLAAAGVPPPTGPIDPLSGKPLAPQQAQTGQNPFADPLSGAGMPAQPAGGTPQYTTPPQPVQAPPPPVDNPFVDPPPPPQPPVPQPQAVAPPAGAQPAKMPAPHDMVRSLFGFQPTAEQPPTTGSTWLPGAPQGQPQAAQPLGADDPSRTAPEAPRAAPQYPQTHGGPMPKSRDLAVVGKMEGGGSYQTQVDAGKGRTALGMYGVLDTNLPEWGPKYLGRAISKEEYLANPELQDRLAQGAFGELRAKYGSGGAAARAWLAGEGGMNDPGRRDAFGTNPFSHEASYNKFAANLGGSVGEGGPGRVSEMSSSGGKPGEAGPATTTQAKLKTLAEMLRGVSKPTAPGAGPTPPNPSHAPLPPQGQKIEGNIMQYLEMLLGGAKGGKKVENLTLNDAAPRKL